ncbi:hypothetical protein [Mesorhizobium sp. M0118]|uniref:hypothetical protein n=1 Tax=Mesorhizobium sp. M0118 TaxID=2956884 RepID=UPI00333C6ED7
MIDGPSGLSLTIDTANASATAGPIGILSLWDGHSTDSGSQTFDGRPVVSEKVPDAWWQALLDDDPGLYGAYAEAARRLVDRGAAAISSGCGYTARYQEAIAAAVEVPVSTGSLLLAPAVIRHLPPGAKLGVVVAHEKYVGADLLGIVHAPEERARIVVDGISGSMLVVSELKRPTGTAPIPDSDNKALLHGRCAAAPRCASGHRRTHLRMLRASKFAPKLRRMTGLPIYDHDTSRRILLAAIT